LILPGTGRGTMRSMVEGATSPPDPGRAPSTTRFARGPPPRSREERFPSRQLDSR